MVLGSMLLLSTLPVTWQYEPNGGPISFFMSAFLPKKASKGEFYVSSLMRERVEASSQSLSQGGA